MENFKILNEKENPLFSRKEIQVGVEAEITPSHLNVEKLISEKFSIPVENIKIKKISGKFGSKTFIITANIYSSKEDKNKIESEKKKESGEEKVEEKIEVKNVESQINSKNKELIKKTESQQTEQINAEYQSDSENDANNQKEQK